MVREITIKALNKTGEKAILVGISDDKKQYGRDFRLMRKVITKNPLTYNIRFRDGDPVMLIPRVDIVNNIIKTMLKNGCEENDFELILYE